MLKRERLEMLKFNDRKIIKENIETSPGPGSYNIRYEFTEEKGPMVSINNFSIL